MSAQPPADSDLDRPLTNEEIEAILASEGASPPESDQPPPKLDIVKREPGAARVGRWVTWLLVAFTILGGLRYWLGPEWKF